MQTANSLHSTKTKKSTGALHASLLLGFALVLIGATSPESRVIYVEETLPTTMNPLFPVNDTDRRAHQLVFDYLYERSVVAEGYRSRIIETIQTEEDGKNFVLNLKKGIRWHH